MQLFYKTNKITYLNGSTSDLKKVLAYEYTDLASSQKNLVKMSLIQATK